MKVKFLITNTIEELEQAVNNFISKQKEIIRISDIKFVGSIVLMEVFYEEKGGEFRLEDYKGGYVMHCDTEEKAIVFCKYLNDHGRYWIDKEVYTNNNYWTFCVEGTCYYFNDGTYGDLRYVDEDSYTILEFDDFDW